MTEELYPRFSAQEMARRHGLARRLMEDEGLACLLFCAMSGTNRNNQANIYYLTGYRDFNHSFLVFPLQGEPSLFVGLYNHLHNAQRMACIADVRHGGYGNPEKVAAQLDKLGLGRSRVGLVGVNPRFGMLLFEGHMAFLRGRFPQAEWVDVSARFRDLRILKSPEEIAWLREGARLTDLSMEALREHARPGVPEYELAGRMLAAYAAEGGEALVQFVTATPMAKPLTPLPWQNPSRRRLQAGDIIHTEISAAYHGYAGQILRPFTVAADPTPPYRALFEAALEVFRDMSKAMRAGAPVGDILAATESLPRRGLKIYDSIAHGFGVDLLQPSIGIPGSGYAAPPADFCYQENMVMVIQPNPMDEAGRGLQMGDLGVVTPEGFQSLHNFPLAITRCG